MTEKQVAEHQVVVLVNQPASEQVRREGCATSRPTALTALHSPLRHSGAWTPCAGRRAQLCSQWRPTAPWPWRAWIGAAGATRLSSACAGAGPPLPLLTAVPRVNDRGDVLGAPQVLESPSLAGLLDADWGALNRGLRFGLHRLFAPLAALRRAVDAGHTGTDAPAAAAAVLKDKGLPESEVVSCVAAAGTAPRPATRPFTLPRPYMQACLGPVGLRAVASVLRGGGLARAGGAQGHHGAGGPVRHRALLRRSRWRGCGTKADPVGKPCWHCPRGFTRRPWRSERWSPGPARRGPRRAPPRRVRPR